MEKHKEKKRSVSGRIIICLFILALAMAGFIGLKSLKKAPPQTVHKERPLKVEALTVSTKDLPVQLTGHGQLTPLREVTLAAQVSGTVTYVHPRLKSGETIQQGELLFSIEDIDYRTDYEINKERLKILKNDLALSQKELTRVKKLYHKNKVGSISGVEGAEKAVNTAADKLAQVQQAMTRAKINLDRCHIKAPFTSRIISYQIEQDQYVTPGMKAVTIADDSLLEVEVPLYGKDAVNWLTIDENPEAQNWFGTPAQVPVVVRWTENPTVTFQGTLHRIADYSAKTRSLKAVIRLNDQKTTTPFPLVAGMFVSAEIPGKMMKDVIQVPRSAVSFENTVYIIRENRLHTIPVTVARVQGEFAYISAGLEEGEQIIITRLIDPLENSLLEIIGDRS